MSGFRFGISHLQIWMMYGSSGWARHYSAVQPGDILLQNVNARSTSCQEAPPRLRTAATSTSVSSTRRKCGDLAYDINPQAAHCSRCSRGTHPRKDRNEFSLGALLLKAFYFQRLQTIPFCSFRTKSPPWVRTDPDLAAPRRALGAKEVRAPARQ